MRSPSSIGVRALTISKRFCDAKQDRRLSHLFKRGSTTCFERTLDVTVTANDIRDHFAEFETLSDTVITRWQTQAERRVNVTQWGEKADDAVLWLTAHLLKLQQSLTCGLDPPSGVVASKKVGDVSVAYKVPDRMSQTFLASTAYGQYYLTLRSGIWPERVLGECCSG